MSAHPQVIIIGAGAAGLMCAIEAGLRGKSVLVLDHAKKMGGKILISGGGRCNFTNKSVSQENYVSENPHFCVSALSRYGPERFESLVQKHKIAYHEKKLGQLFCDDSAQDIINLLEAECRRAHVQIQTQTEVLEIENLKEPLAEQMRFKVSTKGRVLQCVSLVIATGGLSLPKLGASGLGYQIAQQFGIRVTETAPALDGLVFKENTPEGDLFRSLAGLSVDCTITCGPRKFRENILFTHSGISGPAALQASLYWRKEDPVCINLDPDQILLDFLKNKIQSGTKTLLKNVLNEKLPSRLVEAFLNLKGVVQRPLCDYTFEEITQIHSSLQKWIVFPIRTVGYGKAEVTRGGVDTHELSSKTMESKKIPGLYFIGEVVDVTGWLGGYNFQWAWASGWAAGQAV